MSRRAQIVAGVSILLVLSLAGLGDPAWAWIYDAMVGMLVLSAAFVGLIFLAFL